MRLLVLILMLTISRLLPMAETATPRRFPFELHEGLMWTAVSVDDTRLAFVIDTGASVSVIDSTTANRLNLKLGKRVSVAGVGGQTTGHWPTRMNASLDGYELPTKFLSLSLEALSKSCGRRIDGLIGADFFREKIVEFDYRSFQLSILKSDPTAEGERLPLRKTFGGFLVPLQVNGTAQQWFRLDTGCSTELHWVSPTGRKSFRRSAITVGLSQTHTTAEPVTVHVGTSEMTRVPAIIHQRPIFPGEAGLIGTPFLTNFTVILNAKASHLALRKSH